MQDTYIRKAVVQRVVDGDTLAVDLDLGFGIWRMNQKIRVLGVNCPEMHSESHAAGQRAKEATADFFEHDPNVTVQTHTKDTDCFGRVLAKIVRGDGTDLSEYLLAGGFAVPFTE